MRDNVEIGKTTVRVPRGPAGQRMYVRFSYDVSGLLEVDIVVEKTGEKTTLVCRARRADRGTAGAERQSVLGIVALLAVMIRLTMIEQARRTLDRFAPMRPILVGLGIIAAIRALGGLATGARLALYHGDDEAVFLGGALTLLVALPWFAVFGPRYVRWVATAHIALIVAFVMVAGPLLPDVPNGGTNLKTSQTSDASLQRQLQSERVNSPTSRVITRRLMPRSIPRLADIIAAVCPATRRTARSPTRSTERIRQDYLMRRPRYW